MSPEDSLGALQAVLVTFLGHLRAGVLTHAPANVEAEAQPHPGRRDPQTGAWIPRPAGKRAPAEGRGQVLGRLARGGAT